MDSENESVDGEVGLLEPMSVRDRAQMLGGVSSFQSSKETSGLKPYKYDDALKYRFPDRKDYVSAHNYIPTNSIEPWKSKGNYVDSSSVRFKDFFPKENQSAHREEINNLRQMGQMPRSNASGRAMSNSMTGNNSQLPPGLDRTPGNSRFGRNTEQGSGPAGGYGSTPVYQYEDEKTLLTSLKDGTHRLRGEQMPSSQIRRAGQQEYDMKDVERFNQIRGLHKDTLAQETSDNIFFNMMPQVYNYSDNRYQPLTVDKEASNWTEPKEGFDYNMA